MKMTDIVSSQRARSHRASAVMAAAGLLAAVQLAYAPRARAQATGTVNFSSQLQQIDGFGFANPFDRGSYLVNSPAIEAAVLDQFFNPVTGTGATILRIGLTTDTDIEPTAPASPTAPATYVWDGMDGGQVQVAQQAVRYGVKRFYADSWGAPGYMKTNGSSDNGGAICGMPGATACASGDWRQPYANYVTQFARFYQQSGVPITDLSFVNEPDENVSYASLVLSTGQVVDFIDNFFGPTAATSNLHVNLNCCDLTNWSGAKTYANAVIADPTASSYINTYTGHEYGVTATTPINTTKHTWMSEWASANSTAYNASWDIPESPSPGNDGMYLANDISNALTKGMVSAYIYWYGASTGATGGLIQLSATSDATSFVVTRRMYALAGFARFVHPGAYRVPASTSNTNLNITAFINPDGNKVINVVNNATTTVTATLTLDAASANSVPASFLTNETSTIAPVTIASVSGSTLTASFSPRSLSTIKLAPAPVEGTVQLLTTSTLQVLGDGGYQATVRISNNGSGTARDLQLSTAELGPEPGTTMPAGSLPFTLGDIAPGSFETLVVNYPASAGNAGAPVVQKLTGSYTGGVFGSGTFGGSSRVTLP